MLIAPDVAEGNAGNTPTRNSLEIERTAAARKHLDGVSTGPHLLNRSLGQNDLVLIDPRPNKDLISFPGLEKRCTWTRERHRIPRINDKRAPAERALWRVNQ